MATPGQEVCNHPRISFMDQLLESEEAMSQSTPVPFYNVCPVTNSYENPPEWNNMHPGYPRLISPGSSSGFPMYCYSTTYGQQPGYPFQQLPTPSFFLPVPTAPPRHISRADIPNAMKKPRHSENASCHSLPLQPEMCKAIESQHLSEPQHRLECQLRIAAPRPSFGADLENKAAGNPYDEMYFVRFFFEKHIDPRSVIDVYDTPEDMEDAISRYVDFVVFENNKKVNDSVYPMPDIPPRRREIERQKLLAALEQAALDGKECFPTQKFLGWLKLYGVTLQKSDGKCILRQTGLPVLFPDLLKKMAMEKQRQKEIALSSSSSSSSEPATESVSMPNIATVEEVDMKAKKGRPKMPRPCQKQEHQQMQSISGRKRGRPPKLKGPEPVAMFANSSVTDLTSESASCTSLSAMPVSMQQHLEYTHLSQHMDFSNLMQAQGYLPANIQYDHLSGGMMTYYGDPTGKQDDGSQ